MWGNVGHADAACRCGGVRDRRLVRILGGTASGQVILVGSSGAGLSDAAPRRRDEDRSGIRRACLHSLRRHLHTRARDVALGGRAAGSRSVGPGRVGAACCLVGVMTILFAHSASCLLRARRARLRSAKDHGSLWAMQCPVLAHSLTWLGLPYRPERVPRPRALSAESMSYCFAVRPERYRIRPRCPSDSRWGRTTHAARSKFATAAAGTFPGSASGSPPNPERAARIRSCRPLPRTPADRAGSCTADRPRSGAGTGPDHNP